MGEALVSVSTSDHAHPELENSLSSRIVSLFLTGPFPALIIVLSLLAGVVGLLITPREEEPQIVVPMADVLVRAPGLSAEQVERQVATPLEKLLFQIDGVEYVYSMSSQGQTIVTVRFYVGEDREDSLIKIYNKLFSSQDRVPKVVESWIVKPIEIDDVPIVVATLFSTDPKRYDDHHLRRLAEELEIRLQSVENTNAVTLVGGRPRNIRVLMDAEALAAHRTAPLDLEFALGVSNQRLPAGSYDRLNREISVQAGDFVRSASDLADLVVNVVDGIPVYLKDVARIVDGPAELDQLSWIGFGPATGKRPSEDLRPAVGIAVAKKKGTNAVWVAQGIEAKLEELEGTLFPEGVHYRLTRNYGETADEKVSELVEGLAVAVVTVVIFIGLVLGWRPALVIALAIPVCYGATLAINLFAGYTINRVTLFALILALGLLVDDPITDVENIARYFSMGKLKRRHAILVAIQEVRPALILSTLAIVLSFAPMFFITGMMGPYMGPMALNVPLTVLMSMLVAFCVTPYLCYKFLASRPESEEDAPDFRTGLVYRVYSRVMRPFLQRPALAWSFLAAIGLLFFASLALPALRLVPLKMLPFDNKNEFQVVIKMPEGTPLETTDRAARRIAAVLDSAPEVTDYVGYVGAPSPMDFNGLVRHYYLRTFSHLADIRVQLVDKSLRAQQSHEILLRLRDQLEAAATESGAQIQLVETPPGPPVLATVVAEVYGDETTPYDRLLAGAESVMARLRREPFTADVDSTVEAVQEEQRFITDKEKAALSGVGTEEIAKTLRIALQGSSSHYLQIAREAHPLPIKVQLPRESRSSTSDLGALYVKGRPGITKVRDGASLVDAPQPIVPISELGAFETARVDPTIYHKNLRAVAYVYAESVGRPPADIVLDVGADLAREGREESRPMESRTYLGVGGGIPWVVPEGVNVVWTGEGEWKITLDVFRDLGLAFGAALIGIFFVLYVETRSTMLTVIIMTAIPLTMIGIMPGFWVLNAIGDRMVGGYPNPIFFTATAMIGMIALSGIVVRNSLVLIEFVHQALKHGEGLEEALVQSGAIRLRPIFLTAGTTFLGNIVITLDPIFSGLAWSILFGLAASTLFTLGVVPIVYYLVYRNRPGHGIPEAEEEL